jgi:hypothetical protein
MRAAATLGHINTRVILPLLFYVVITPIGLVRRIFRDPLERAVKDDRPNHWIRLARQASPATAQRRRRLAKRLRV